MTDTTIPFGRPMMGQEEIDAVTEVLSGPTLVHGAKMRGFEEAFAKRIGVKHAIAVSNCTAGLHLSLFVKEIGPGDTVALPAMTHVATAHAIEFCGGTPVFVDVQEDTGNIDPAAIPVAGDPPLRAIIPVHFLGLPCDMDAIMTLADRHSLFVVEDCALAVDAAYGDRKAGGLGHVGCFSFYPIKHMTTIEGGMVTTDDDDLAAAIAQRRAFGYDRTVDKRQKPGLYDVNALGYNYRMNEVEAAVGLVQMSKLDGFQIARAENFRILKSELDEIDEITVFSPAVGKSRSSHYCLNAVLPRNGSIDRDEVVGHLTANGIGTSVHYPQAVPLMTYYAKKYGYRTGQYPMAEWLANQTISLPVGPHLAEGDAARIGAEFKRAIVSVQG
jgi:dTDP-4-amino-4,6-dideoxygalactose transaminase